MFEHLLWPYVLSERLQDLNAGGHFLISTPFLVKSYIPMIAHDGQNGLKYSLAEVDSPGKDRTESLGEYGLHQGTFKGETLCAIVAGYLATQ